MTTLQESGQPTEARRAALKREARELQRSVKRSLAECRDRIAYREGFKNWPQMDAAYAKATGAAS